LGGRSAVKRFVAVVFAALFVLVGATIWWLKLEPGPPTVEIENAKDVVGRTAAWDIVVRAKGHPGLRRIDVGLRAGGQLFPLFSEQLPADGPRVTERRVRVEADLAAAGVPQGPAQLEISADTSAWHLSGGTRGAQLTRELTVDTVPPRVDLLTTQHNMRLGGTAVAVFRLGPDAVDAHVDVGDYSFPAIRGYFADPAVALALLLCRRT
jgi:hypothetical protein